MNRRSKLDRVPTQPKLIDEVPSISLQQHRRQIALQRRGRDRFILLIVVIISSLFFSLLAWLSRGYYLRTNQTSAFQEKISSFTGIVSKLIENQTLSEKPFQLVSADSARVRVTAELPAFMACRCVASHSPEMDKFEFWKESTFSAGSVRPRTNEDEEKIVSEITQVDIFSPRDRSYVHCAYTSEASFNETTAQLSSEVFTLNAKEKPLDLFRPVDLTNSNAIRIAQKHPDNLESEVVVDLDLPAHVSHYCVMSFETPEVRAEKEKVREPREELGRERLMDLWEKGFLDEEYRDKMFFIFKNVVDSYKGISTFFSEEKKYKSRYDLAHFFSGHSVTVLCVAATGVKEALAMKKSPPQAAFNSLNVEKTSESVEDLLNRIENQECKSLAKSIHEGKSIDVDFYKVLLYFDSSSLLKSKLNLACNFIKQNEVAEKELVKAVYDQGFQMAKLIHYIAGTGVVLQSKLKKVVESISPLFGKYKKVKSENETAYQNEGLNEVLNLLERVAKKIMVLEEGGDKMVHRSEGIARNIGIVQEIKELWNKIGKIKCQ